MALFIEAILKATKVDFDLPCRRFSCVNRLSLAPIMCRFRGVQVSVLFENGGFTGSLSKPRPVDLAGRRCESCRNAFPKS